MPLTVASFTPYLSNNAPVKARPEDWHAIKFIKALKGQPIKGWATIPFSGQSYNLEQGNIDLSLQIFADWAANYIKQKKIRAPGILVPIPNSSCTIDDDSIPRTVNQAEVLVKRLKRASVLDCLRWTHDMGSASRGTGTRRPQELYDSLALTSKKLPNGSYILVDDVKTTGGHLQAIRAMFQTREIECDLAICGGRTVWDHEQEPFSFAEEEIEDWWPTGKLL